MKLGTKIAGGFMLLIVIAMILGAVAIVQMSNVRTESTKLADEYVPELKLAGDLERNSYRTMYNMRGYSLTGKQDFLDKGDAALGDVEETLTATDKLSQDAKNLDKLREALPGIKNNVGTYAKLKDDTVKLTAKMEENRNNLDINAQAYMKNCNDFLEAQNAKFKTDLEERVKKVGLVSAIVDLGNQVRVMNFKGQATNDPDLIKSAIEELKGVRKLTAELRKITRLEADIKRIDETEAAADQYVEAMSHFVKEFAKGSDASAAVIASERKEMDAAAGRYVKNCEEFLVGQQKALKHDMNERHDKITIVNDIIDIGNATRVATFKAQAVREPADMQKAYDENFKKMDEMFEALRKITYDKEDIDRIDGTKKAAQGYATAMGNYLTNWNKMDQLNVARGDAADKVLDAASSLSEAATSAGTEIANGARDSLGTASTIMVVGLVIALIVGVALAWVITVSITRPINRIIAGLTDGSEQVTSASGQISSSSQQLAEGATEQAASLEETSSALEEMASMTRQNADNAGSANNMMTETQQQVQQGSVAVKNMAGAMSEINQSSEEIGKIIKTIEEIAFQTNLLALNAAVEAARAGDAGKGFAVVADEVRNLAQRSAQAARDTAELIEGTVTRVKNGTAIVEELEKSFGEVEVSAGKVAGLVAEISAASNEQAQGVDQVNTAVAQMDKVTQSNAANAEESASAAEEMNAQADQLNEMVNQLTALVGGSSGNGHVAATRARASTQVAHQPAKRLSGGGQKPAKAQGGAQVVKPNDVIPLDGDDDDFSEF